MNNTAQASAALMELTLENLRVTDSDFTNFQVKLLNCDSIPAELVTRLEELWKQTKVVAGEVIHIGKIIVSKIIDFIKQYPNMFSGIAIGVIASLLASSIPIIGALLSPIVGLVGVSFGAIKGLAMDSKYQDEIQMIISLSKDFFASLISMFQIVFERFLGE